MKDNFFCGIICAIMLFSSCKSENNAYMFSYFAGENSGLCLAYSYDGLTWRNVKDTIYLVPNVGHDKLMRDPSVTCGPDGTYHMVWTTSWHENCIGYSSTKDFIHWSEQKQIDVMAHEPNVMNSWAPEITYNSDDSTFYIYWASTIPGRHSPIQSSDGDGGLNHRIYYTRTKDFETFSPTEVFFNKDFSVIDAALVRSKVKKDWIMVLKNENIVPPEKNIRMIRTDNLNNGFPGNVSEPFSTPDVWCEGPSPLYVGDTLYVYYDQYVIGKYGASRSVDDGNTWEDISDMVSFPKGTRHGTAFKVPQKILDNLLSN